MRQLSLLNHIPFVGVMPAIRAAMNRAAGDAEGEGRKMLVDRLNTIARNEGVKLTAGNVKGISKDILDKWLSPSDVSHTPSVNAILAFCRATKDYEPLRIMTQALGLDIMTDEDRRHRDIGRASEELEAARKRFKRAKERI